MELNKYLPLTETTYYILLSLLEPAHGYIMMQKVDQLSNHKVKIAAGTMYGAIENLLNQQLIKSVKSTDKRRKTYVITEKGIEVLRLDCQRMKHIIQITEKSLPEYITREMERLKMYKFRFFIDFEKEEQWLETMASDGYHLKNTFIGYQFQRGKPEAATIKIDFRKFRNKRRFHRLLYFV